MLLSQKYVVYQIGNPSQFDVIRKSVSKTDKNDAQALAFYLSKDMLPICRRKTKSYQRVASLSQTRDKFVKSRTYFMNKVHGLLNSFGIKLKKESLSTNKGLNKLLENKIDKSGKFELEMLVQQIHSLSDSIKQLDAS